MSVSAGGRRCRRVYRWINARYWPCLGVKFFAARLTPAIRFSCSSVPRMKEEAQMNVRYRVELSQTERAELTALLSGGKHAARKLKRAQILLAADAGASDDDIAKSVGAGGSTVYRTKQRFVLGNLEAALSEKSRPGASRKLTGKEEALLVATACSKPPQGRARWTLELLAGELVKLTGHGASVGFPSGLCAAFSRRGGWKSMSFRGCGNVRLSKLHPRTKLARSC